MDTSVGGDDVEAVWSRLQKAMTDPDGLQNPYPLLREMHRYGDRLRTPSGVHAVFGYNRVNELTRSPLFKKDTAVIFLIHATAFAPGTYRISSLLEQLGGRLRIPAVLFYPGRWNHTLNYMGLRSEDQALGSYRVKIYGRDS